MVYRYEIFTKLKMKTYKKLRINLFTDIKKLCNMCMTFKYIKDGNTKGGQYPPCNEFFRLRFKTTPDQLH